MASVKILILALNIFLNHYYMNDVKEPTLSSFSYALNEATCLSLPVEQRNDAAECHAFVAQQCLWLSASDIEKASGLSVRCEYSDNGNDALIEISRGENSEK